MFCSSMVKYSYGETDASLVVVNFYSPTKSEGYSFGVVHPSVRPFRPSLRLEPYLSTYWSDLIHS